MIRLRKYRPGVRLRTGAVTQVFSGATCVGRAHICARPYAQKKTYARHVCPTVHREKGPPTGRCLLNIPPLARVKKEKWSIHIVTPCHNSSPRNEHLHVLQVSSEHSGIAIVVNKKMVLSCFKPSEKKQVSSPRKLHTYRNNTVTEHIVKQFGSIHRGISGHARFDVHTVPRRLKS